MTRGKLNTLSTLANTKNERVLQNAIYNMRRNFVKVAIDAGPLKSGHKVRGIGVHTRELLGAFRQVIKLHSNQATKIEAVDFSRADLSKFDIVHYQDFHPYFVTLPKKKLAKTVVTIHDLIPLIYPKHYPSGTKGNFRFLIQKQLLKKVDAIVTISETSKKDICRFLGVDPGKVFVIPLAPRKIFRKVVNSSVLHSTILKYNLPKKFVLYVGDINHNKNIPTLVEACKLAKVPLVICGKQALEIEGKGIDIYSLRGPRDWVRYLFGKPHPETAHYQDVLDKIKSYKNVIRLGFVSDKDLVAIYNLASVYVQPSFYEGFALPILEAQASGCPVVASKIQAHVEIAEGSALFIDPNNAKDIAKKITLTLKNIRYRGILVKEGLRNSRRFSWDKTAEKTLEVYKTLFQQHEF